MITRPRISRNKWKLTEIWAFKVEHFAPFCCPGRRREDVAEEAEIRPRARVDRVAHTGRALVRLHRGDGDVLTQRAEATVLRVHRRGGYPSRQSVALGRVSTPRISTIKYGWVYFD